MADWLPPPPPVDPPVIPPEEPTTTTVAVVTPPTYGVETPWIILSVLGVLMFLISFGFFVSKRFPNFTRSTINLGFSLTGLCLLPCALLIGWIRNNPNQDAQELQIVVIVLAVFLFMAIALGHLNPNARWSMFFKILDIIIAVYLKTKSGRKFLAVINSILEKLGPLQQDLPFETRRIMALEAEPVFIVNEEHIVIEDE